jgi:hypothetical protein
MTKPEDAVEQVFNAWKSHRPRPALCRFTADRAKLLRDRLALGYSAADLLALIAYVFTADDKWCVFMRENDYTGLDYLLRKEKLGDRVERALAWQERAQAEKSRKDRLEQSGVELGALGTLRHRHPPGEA